MGPALGLHLGARPGRRLVFCIHLVYTCFHYQFLNCCDFIFRSGIAGTCHTREASNLASVYLASAFLFRYNSKCVVFMRCQTRRFSSGFVDASISVLTKRN